MYYIDNNVAIGSDSEDDDDDDVSVLAPGFTFPPASEPINIAKPVTPAQSVIGDDFSVESPSAAMDVDIVGAVLFHRETFAKKFMCLAILQRLTGHEFMAVYAPADV